MYAIITNISFGPDGEIVRGGNMERNRIFGLFESQEDARAVADFLDRLWLEAVREWDEVSENWKPLTEAQADARPVVRHLQPWETDLSAWKETFGIATNVYFTDVERVACDFNASPFHVIALFQSEHDAKAVASYIDRLWMEEAERWSFKSRQPLTDAQADARPSVLRIGSEEMPEWV